jgi:hypothetical protein
MKMAAAKQSIAITTVSANRSPNESMAHRHKKRPGAASLRPGLPRNAIADGANSAAMLASAQSDHFGIADKEGATVSNRARADSLAYE